MFPVVFKDGEIEGNNFGNASDFFINKNPKECPIKVCIVNQENCNDPLLSGLVSSK